MSMVCVNTLHFAGACIHCGPTMVSLGMVGDPSYKSWCCDSCQDFGQGIRPRGFQYVVTQWLDHVTASLSNLRFEVFVAGSLSKYRLVRWFWALRE